MFKHNKKAIAKYIREQELSEATKTMLHRMVKRSELGRGQRPVEWYIENAPVAFYHWQQLIREGLIR